MQDTRCEGGFTVSVSFSPSRLGIPEVGETRLIFNIVVLDINALSLTMLKRCNPITDEGGVLVLQKLPHSTYHAIIVSKMATTKLRLEFREAEIRWC